MNSGAGAGGTPGATPANTSTVAGLQHAQRMALIRAQQSMAQQQQQMAPASYSVAPGARLNSVRPVVSAAAAASQPRPSVGSVQSTVSQAGRNIVINQPGMRPGVPGSQITVPLTALQSLQPGQGIPTGQAGHLLVKTETGQFQILKVGQAAGVTSATAAVASVPRGTPTSALPGAVVPSTAATAAVSRTTVAAATTASAQIRTSAGPTGRQGISSSAAGSNTATSSATSGSASSGSGGSGGGQHMTPETARLKCKNFLTTLLRLTSEQPVSVANNVRTLIQRLIDGNVEPEDFTLNLQKELNSSPQPSLATFLKKSLPFLQDSLRKGEMTIEGVSAVPLQTQAAATFRPAAPVAALAQQQQRPATASVLAAQQQLRSLTPSLPTHPNPPVPQHVVPTTTPSPLRQVRIPSAVAQQQQPQQRFVTPSAALVQQQQVTKLAPPGIRLPLMGTNKALPQQHQHVTPSPAAMASMKDSNNKKLPLATIPGAAANSTNSNTATAAGFSAAGDEDIMDVAAMGGVNLAEESQRMQQGSADLIGTQIRSCKDQIFLQTGNLSQRISKLCAARGLAEPGADVMALMSHATQDRLKTLLEKLSMIAEHRMDVIRLEGDAYEVTQDVKGQVKFLSELDKLEKARHEQAERQRLLVAAKSRNKTDDPEKERLKEKAKEMQRLEEEQMLQDKANTTALLAIGGPKKKLRLDEHIAVMPSGGAASVGTASAAMMMQMRPRTKRVNPRDLVFLMEQERDLKRSPLLWRAYVNS